MNKNEQILEVIEGFKNLTSKIKEDDDSIKNSLKNKDLTINACKKEYRKLYGEHEELKRYAELETKIKKNEEEKLTVIGKKRKMKIKNNNKRKKQIILDYDNNNDYNADDDDDNNSKENDDNDDDEDDDKDYEILKVKKKNKK